MHHFSSVVLVAVLSTVLQLSSCFGQDDLYRRYTKLQLLTSCLGEETMARWRAQLVVASSNCAIHAAPAGPASSSFFIRQQSHFVPLVPSGSSIPQQQQTFQHQQFHQLQHHQQQAHHHQNVPQLVHYTPSTSSSYPYQKYFLIGQSQPPKYFTPMAVAQYPGSSVQGYNPNIPNLNYFSQQSQFAPPQQQTIMIQPSQTYVPPKAGTTLGQFINTAATAQVIDVPAPIIQFHKLQQQKKKLQQQGFPQPISFDGSANAAKPIIVKQEDTYRNPAIKYEQTEQYLEEQRILAAVAASKGDGAEKQKDAAADGSSSDPALSYNRNIRYRGHQLGTRQKRSPSAELYIQQQQPQQTQFAYRQNHQQYWPQYWQPQATAPSSAKFPQYQLSPQDYEQHQLSVMRNRVADKISNMTCVMRAMGLLTDDLQPNHIFIEQSLIELPIANALFDDLKEGQKYCRASSECLPRRRQIHDLPVSQEFTRSLEYFRCFGKEKLRACLNHDVLAMAQLLGSSQNSHFSSARSTFGEALDDVEGLLNGATGQFVDLLLM